MDWDKGFTAIYYANVVDPMTWMDKERIEISKDGSNTVKRTLSDLREAASLEFVDNQRKEETWIRIWLDAYQGDESSHVALFTGLACSPTTNIDGRLFTDKVDCYSVLKPAQDVLLERGWYAPMKTDTAAIIRSLMSNTPAPIDIADGIPQLSSNIIAEDGENALSMTDAIVTAVGWRLMVTGYGRIQVKPLAESSSITIGSTMYDIIERKLEVSYDYYECPNVFRAVSDNEHYVARDDDPNSIFSTVSRGREIWAEETNCDLYEGESIEFYAKRRLLELQQVGHNVDYNRRFVPGIAPSDIVTLSYPEQGVDGQYIVVSQDLDLINGCSVSEEVQKI